MSHFSKTLYLILIAAIVGCVGKQVANFPFQNEIDQFKIEDKTFNKKDGVILFVGSSSFALWKTMKQDLECDKIINRGFGGSTLTDLINHKKQLFSTFHPKQIFIYCGENDLATKNNVSASEVLSRWKIIHAYIRKKNKKSQIYFLSLKPSPSRWHLRDTMQHVNYLIKQYNQTKENTYFIDLWSHMVTQGLKPNPEIYLKDSLHMNNMGYNIWIDQLKPFLDCN